MLIYETKDINLNNYLIFTELQQAWIQTPLLYFKGRLKTQQRPAIQKIAGRSMPDVCPILSFAGERYIQTAY